MTETTTTASTRRRVLPFVAGAIFLCVLSAGVGAGAATLVTSAQIKNGTIVSIDVKNGSLTGKDLKNNSVSGRDVKDGTVTGTDVKDGSVGTADVSPELNAAMVDDLIPSGTTVTGIATLDLASNAGGDFAFTVDLPGRAHAPLTGGLVNFGGDDTRIDDISSECTGTAGSPTAPPGMVCIYLIGAASESASIQGGGLGGVGSDRGFSVYWTDNAGSITDVFMTVAWAYTAP